MGRTRTGRRGTTEPAARARPAVRDFSGGAATYAVEFDQRTVYDFLISLTIGAGTDNDLLPEDQRWLREARGSLPEQLRVELDTCFGETAKGVYHDLAGLPIEYPGMRTAADAVAVLEAMDWREIVRSLVPEAVAGDGGAEALDRVLAGDRRALETMEQRLPEHHRAQLVELLRQPQERVDGLRQVLRAWLPRFQEVEERVGRMARRDVADRAAERGSLPPGDLIERVTGGLRFLPEPQVRRVVLAPSYFSRPYNYIFQGVDWRLFCYPIADAAVADDDGVTPPPAVVRLYRALGDPTRLRILKLLGDRDWYLTELAQQLELSKPTMKHHLAQLRAAGLVTVVEEGSLTYYSIRPQRLEEAGIELRRYLG